MTRPVSLRALLRRYRASLLLGALAGLVLMPLGLFIGLQVSPALGTLLLAPFALVTAVTGIPIGSMPQGLPVLLALLTYAGLGALIQHLIRRAER